MNTKKTEDQPIVLPNTIQNEKPDQQNQVRKSSIHPSSSQSANVREIIATVKTSNKPLFKKEKALLFQQVENCFGTISEKVFDLPSMANFCFEKAWEKLLSSEFMRTEEIISVYKLFFGSDLKTICKKKSSSSLDLINPHPCYVFQSLYDCLEALEFKPFQETIEKREIYIENDKNLKWFLEQRPLLRCDILSRLDQKKRSLSRR